jgi:hypothetical protein
MREYFENLHFNNLKEMDKFLDSCYIPRLNQEGTNINRPITKIEAIRQIH